MDKRWIGIILILIIGLFSMYLIVDNSTSVGNACTVVGDESVTVPPGLKIGNTDALSATLYNPSNNDTIIIKFIGKGDTAQKEYKNSLNSLKQHSNINIIKHEKNNDTYMIQYENITSKNPKELQAFVAKDNRTISMKFIKYTDADKQKQDMDFIVKTLKHDYKQNKPTDNYQEFTI